MFVLLLELPLLGRQCHTRSGTEGVSREGGRTRNAVLEASLKSCGLARSGSRRTKLARLKQRSIEGWEEVQGLSS